MSTLYRDKKNTTQKNRIREVNMNHEDIVKLVEKYPNDMQLGREVRQLYWQERDKVIREGLDLPAQQSITEGTSVTSIDDQMEEVWTQIEKEELQRFPGTNSKDYTVKPEKVYGYDANGSPVEEEIDITSAYTRNPHPRTGI